jgi:predicted aspartyl protease
MPTHNCSPPPQAGTSSCVRLIECGAIVPLTVRSHTGAEAKLHALIDTGSEYSVIDEGVAKQLQLALIGQATISALNQQVVLNLYRAELEVPPLGIKEFGQLLGGVLSGKQEALLGREQLRDCELFYSGPSGIVTLKK